MDNRSSKSSNTTSIVFVVAFVFFWIIVSIFGGLYLGGVFTKRDTAVADKVAADKVAADKVAADKVAADKVAADKVAADKVAADKVAAAALVKVSFFTDGNYTGSSSELGIGRYLLTQMGIPNDTLSSIKIPAGRTVQVFSDGFDGPSRTYTSDVAILSNDWNDKATALIIS